MTVLAGMSRSVGSYFAVFFATREGGVKYGVSYRRRS